MPLDIAAAAAEDRAARAERAASSSPPPRAAAPARSPSRSPSRSPPRGLIPSFPAEGTTQTLRFFGDGFAQKTLLQTAPSDPRLSRAALPAGYDRKSAVLLARLAAAAAGFAVVVAWAGAWLVAAVGVRQLLVLLAAAEVAFFVWYRRRCLLAAGLPVVAVEYKHVSQRLCSIIPSADEIADGAAALLDRLGLEQVCGPWAEHPAPQREAEGACVVAHSYGTFVASRLAQLHPQRLQSLALLDPVCFGMFMPHLLANFIYRKPRTTSAAVWIKDIPGRTLVALAGNDQLIHVDEVLDFIQHYAAKILYHPHHTHAALLLDAAWQQQLVADIAAMAGSGGGTAGAAEVERRLTSVAPVQQPQQAQQRGDGSGAARAEGGPMAGRGPAGEAEGGGGGGGTSDAELAALAADLKRQIRAVGGDGACGEGGESASAPDLAAAGGQRPLPWAPPPPVEEGGMQGGGGSGEGGDSGGRLGLGLTAPSARRRVQRRVTATATLQYSSPPGPEEQLLMELANFGASRSVLLKAPPASATATATANDRGRPTGVLTQQLAAICESGPSTPLAGAVPPLAAQARRPGGAARPRRTLTSSPPGPEEQLLMELANFGASRSVLLKAPPASATATATTNDRGRPTGVLTQQLAAICESGPSTPLAGAVPPLAAQARRPGGAARPRRTLTS
ncbi:hypothetical protein TSOC_010242 [Tetrabaena socialis]|uniref:AB hydrolase-1 domain-containing protein n=1 Tax=Tetrabaena socialis TaxID=47790 RepID=A0A2J7ZTU5_9CHLO|nr:hypothetical protein TSOC_010242 [Tetrabaena socialis]|eukprot:PNH03682.1 hypothetical protein TSOC_010242 [Tetrabaena socialis]